MNYLIKNFRFCFLGAMALVAFSLTSCESEDSFTVVDVENFTDESVRSMQKGAIGKRHCLELIFPVSIEFVDGSTAEVSDYDNLKETIIAFFVDNELEKDAANRPSLVFPLEVLNEEGEIIQVADEDMLDDLKSECPGRQGNSRGFKCFDIVFPVNVLFGEETLSFENKDELKAAIKEFRETNDGDVERPSLVFPISVEFEDETITEVSSQEDLRALKENCRTQE